MDKEIDGLRKRWIKKIDICYDNEGIFCTFRGYTNKAQFWRAIDNINLYYGIKSTVLYNVDINTNEYQMVQYVRGERMDGMI